jgi:hypothetical protein
LEEVETADGGEGRMRKIGRAHCGVSIRCDSCSGAEWGQAWRTWPTTFPVPSGVGRGREKAPVRKPGERGRFRLALRFNHTIHTLAYRPRETTNATPQVHAVNVCQPLPLPGSRFSSRAPVGNREILRRETEIFGFCSQNPEREGGMKWTLPTSDCPEEGAPHRHAG